MSNTWLTVKEAAQTLGVGPLFIQRRCRSGEIPAVRIGSDYRIARAELDAWLGHRQIIPSPASLPTSPAEPGDLLALLDAWLSYLGSVKAVSPNTLRTHRGHLRNHLRRMAVLGHQALTIEALFERKTMLAVFARIPVKSFATKYNTYNALLSLGHFLIAEGHLAPEALADVKALKPRRQLEPRRTSLKPMDVPRLFDTILTRPNSPLDNLTVAAMIAVMVYAGLRVSEVCNLRPVDVDLAAHVLGVRHGKGGKDRRVGIAQALYGYLKQYQTLRAEGPTFFTQAHGAAWEPLMLAKRMRLISRHMGVDITCHGLRRTFATLAANQGRSVNAIRIALGHANLETTQAYLRTSEAEVVEAMKGW